MDEKENIDDKFLICKSGDLLLARRSQRLRRAGAFNKYIGTVISK